MRDLTRLAQVLRRSLRHPGALAWTAAVSAAMHASLRPVSLRSDWFDTHNGEKLAFRGDCQQ